MIYDARAAVMRPKARILSVSNDADLLAGRERLLERAGYTVISAHGPNEACKRCNEDFDLILLGYILIESEQREVASVFRASGCKAPVLVMLRPGQKAIPEADLGVEPTPESVLEAVHTLLERHSSFGQ